MANLRQRVRGLFALRGAAHDLRKNRAFVRICFSYYSSIAAITPGRNGKAGIALKTIGLI